MKRVGCWKVVVVVATVCCGCMVSAWLVLKGATI